MKNESLDIMVVSSSSSESQYMVMFDTEAPRKHATQSEISCPSTGFPIAFDSLDIIGNQSCRGRYHDPYPMISDAYSPMSYLIHPHPVSIATYQ